MKFPAMKNKKSFEMQFNWIFVLIIGAAILLFFASIIFKQKNLSDVTSKTELLRDIESLIDGASVSLDTTNTIALSKSNMDISCNKISIGGTSKQYQNLILFAPSSIKGNTLVSQTLAFSIPYRSANLLYMTSQQVRYILIGNSDLAREINKTVPNELSKEKYSSYDESKIKDLNNYKVRFVFTDSNLPSNVPASLLKMPDSDVTALKISGDNQKGTLEFYQKNNNAWASKGSSVYIKMPSLIGAIYTDKEELYFCNMQNVFSRAKIVTTVYNDRTNQIANVASTGSDCKKAYINALPKLNIIRDSLSNLTTARTFDIANADKIISSSKDISTQNKEAQKFSCPTIY